MTTINLGNKFNTSKVQNMSGMFQDFAKSQMTSLDLGPAFTKISTSDTNFMKNCGNSTLVIYAPESIYLNRNTFKTN